MLKFGIVGTSWISDAFIEAGLKIVDFKVNAVYSRKIEKAKEFGLKYNIDNYYNDLEEMAKSKNIDAVYIASPNSLHFEQVKIFLKNKIACFVEKPITSTPKELKILIDLAKENKTLLMEGMMTTQTPNFKVLKDNLLRLGDIRKITGIFCQYSSKYDRFKDGIYTNAFDPKWSNGSLMDIGVYLVEPILALFGKPLEVKASCTMLPNSIDGEGNIILKYSDFNANLIYSKIANSYLPSEIQGEEGSIIIEKWSQMEELKFIGRSGEKEIISLEQEENKMYYELKNFIDTYKNGKIESSINTLATSLLTQEILEKARKTMGFSFPADKN